MISSEPHLISRKLADRSATLRYAGLRSLRAGPGVKFSDEFTVSNHRDLHRVGKEVDWWSKIGIQPN